MSQKFHHPGGKSQSGGESSDGDAPGFGKILWDWNRGIKEAFFCVSKFTMILYDIQVCV